jgi:glycosyltransferase involved in cell wall biosynthesis
MPDPPPVPVAIFLAGFDAGGTEGQMIELATRLDRSKWQVHLACFRQGGSWLPRAREGAASIGTFPLTSLASPMTIVEAHRFSRWCAERRIALVHTAQLYPNIFGLPAARAAGIPVRIANRRNLGAGGRPWLRAFERTALRLAHVVVANSNAAAACLRTEGLPSDRIAVVRNGIDADAFASPRRVAHPRRVIVVGNLRAGKGHDVLLRAVPLVLARHPDATFHVVGDGPLGTEVRALADTSGISAAVTFHGHQEDVRARLADADIFVLPSLSESSPNALLEAMAAGIAVVASNVGGVPEIVDDGRTGLLAPPADPAALADRIVQLMDAPDVRHRLAAAAQAHVASRHSFEEMVRQFDGLYSAQLRKHAGSS